MIGICPHCKINLKEPPFTNRELNEIIIVILYRKRMDMKIPIKSVEELGYCEICKAKLEDLEKQKSSQVN